jgi:hypothetical protein
MARLRGDDRAHHRGRDVSSFAAEWLALREPYDGQARNADVLAAVEAAFTGLASMIVVDLACGTGSTMRAIAPRLPPRQIWQLVDNNLSLLGRAASAAPSPAMTVRATPVDLAHDLEAALDGPADLVTASALLDLVSKDWLDRFVVETAARRLPVYAALTYDGRVEFDPGDPLDTAVVASVNRHQRRDKGFGPALGPMAAAAAIDRFRNAGHTIVQGLSDWVFAPHDHAIQNDVVAGWAGAAEEMDELPLADIVGWLTRRRDLIAAGRSRIRVGHVDVFARPTAMR